MQEQLEHKWTWRWKTRIAAMAIVVTTALIMIFPEIVLWLPNRMK